MEPIFIRHPYTPPAFVYRVYAEDGELLYVGSTGCVQTRLNDHAVQRQPWFPLAHRVEVEQLSTRQAARDVERAAIIAEKPIGNTKNTERDRANRPALVHPRLESYAKNRWAD